MKIVHSIFTMKMGGAQVLLVDMVNNQCADNQISLIIVNDQFNQALLAKIDRRVEIIFINRKEGSRNILPLIKYNYYLQKLRPDVVHFHEPNMINITFYRRFKRVFTIHDVGKPTSKFNRYNCLVAISNSVSEDVFKRSNASSILVYNGIDFNSFKKRTNYKVEPNEKIKLVQLSRLIHEKKGQDILIKAVHFLVTKKRYTNLTLDIIGSGNSYDYLQSLIHSLGLGDYVKLVGEKERSWVVENLCNYHVLVQPSRYEGFGLTVVEGIAAGLAVIASNIEGPAEIFKNFSHVLFESNNITDCASVLSQTIQQYESNTLEPSMTKTYEEISHKFSVENTSDQYMEIYKNLVSN